MKANSHAFTARGAINMSNIEYIGTSVLRYNFKEGEREEKDQ